MQKAVRTLGTGEQALTQPQWFQRQLHHDPSQSQQHRAKADPPRQKAAEIGVEHQNYG